MITKEEIEKIKCDVQMIPKNVPSEFLALYNELIDELDQTETEKSEKE